MALKRSLDRRQGSGDVGDLLVGFHYLLLEMSLVLWALKVVGKICQDGETVTTAAEATVERVDRNEFDTKCDGSSMVATITMIQVTGSQRRQLVDVQFSGEPAKVSSLLQVS